MGMDEKRFSRPVRIHIAELGSVRYVSDVHEALDCLMYGWPTERNSQHARAIETCLNVIAKNAQANEAGRLPRLCSAFVLVVSVGVYRPPMRSKVGSGCQR
jgi:hypothetical protein